MASRLATWEKYLLLATAAFIAIVGVLVIRQVSVTPDEAIYIATGLTYIQQHEERLNLEHPPLEKVLAAIPLLLDGARPSYESPAWTSPEEVDFSQQSLRSWGELGARRGFLARLPMVLLTVLLGVTIFWIGRGLAGPWGGFLSLAAYASSPFFYAYGPLVLTDIGVALFVLLAGWTFASLWQEPSLTKSIWFGLALSGAFLSKFSSGLLLPVFFVLAIWYVLSPPQPLQVRRALRYSIVGLVISAVVVFATYGLLFWKTDLAWLFRYQADNTNRSKGILAAGAAWAQAHPSLSHAFYPVILYLWGVSKTLHTLVRPTFVLGKVYEVGTPLFFPAMFFYKMTPGFLVLSALLLLLWLWRRVPGGTAGGRTQAPLHVRAIALIFVVFTLAAVSSKLNIGLRHLSVSIAALVALISLIVSWVSTLRSTRLRTGLLAAAVVAIVASFGSTLAGFPDYIGYFNRLKGDRPNYEIATGADLDWGQSLIELRGYLQQHQIRSVDFDVKGSVPEWYLPTLPAFECEKGVPADAEWVAVGASRFITTVGFKIDPAVPVPHCEYLFHNPYWVNSSGSLYVFHMRPENAGRDAPSSAVPAVLPASSVSK